MPSPGPSFARAQPLRLHGQGGALGPRVRLGMTKPTVMVDDWWVFTLWVEDEEGVVECRAVAPPAGPPPTAPLQVIGPTLANSLMGFLDQEDGRQLIRMIVASLAARHDYDEYSLFVYRDNEPAYRCYLSLGFVVRDYPDGAPMPDKCYFLTRKSGLLL